MLKRDSAQNSIANYWVQNSTIEICGDSSSDKLGRLKEIL